MYMNVKEKIISKVNSIQDPSLLEELLRAAELEHEIEQLKDLSTEEKEAIDEGIKDAEAGNMHSNEEATHLVKEWLKK